MPSPFSACLGRYEQPGAGCATLESLDLCRNFATLESLLLWNSKNDRNKQQLLAKPKPPSLLRLRDAHRPGEDRGELFGCAIPKKPKRQRDLGLWLRCRRVWLLLADVSSRDLTVGGMLFDTASKPMGLSLHLSTSERPKSVV